MISTLAVRHHIVEAPSGLLHRLQYPGQGIPLVCLHGVAGCAWGWHEVARALVGRVELQALDMRGHGDSSWSGTGQYSTAMHVADLAAQIDSIGLSQVDLVGSSWGALVALEYAAANPDRVRRLALVDIEPSFVASSRDVPPRPRSFDDLAAVLAWLRSNHPNAPDASLNAMAVGAFRASTAGTLVPKHDPVFFECWPFRDGNHWATLDQVTSETLLVRAQATFVRAEVMEEMKHRLPNATLVQLENSTHAVSVDNPTDLAAQFASFFVEVPLTRSVERSGDGVA